MGLSVVGASAEYDDGSAFSPHYAGIPAQELVAVVKDLDLNIRLDFVNCE